MPSLMVSCGEPSGDLYAGALVRELTRLDPACAVFGYGGPQLAAAGGELVGDYRGSSVTGLAEAIRVLPRTYAMYRRLVVAARDRRPAALVLVDFPDFNFRLGLAARRLRIPVVYYIAPQLWAWRAGRLATMKRFVDRVLVIFPFEEALYQREHIPVEFVGHPLLELARATEERISFLNRLGFDAGAPTLALLPGSRRNELEQILPTLVAALPAIRSRVPRVQVLVARAPGLDERLFAPVSSIERSIPIRSIEGQTDTVLAAANAVVTASGTATIQTAIHGRPMVIVYRLSPLTYRIGKPFVNVDTYGMVNLVAGRRIVRELIQDEFTAARVADEAVRLLTDEAYVDPMRTALAEVVGKLGRPGASRRAAEAILQVAAG